MFPELSHRNRLVVPRVLPLISTSVGETTTASATAGSPMENRWMLVGLTSNAEAPFETDTTCSGARTTRCAWDGRGTARPTRSVTPKASDRSDKTETGPRRWVLTGLPGLRFR